MLKKLIIIFMLLLMVFILNAWPSELSAEEFQQRRVELQRRADRFKQETGFEGSIEVSVDRNKLAAFRGNFQNLTVTELSDTLEVRQVFEEVVDRLIQYLPASRDQLKKKQIWGSSLGTGTDYIQVVNGYEIERAGLLRMSYNFQKKRMTILNALVPIDPTPVTPVITEEQAKEIGMNAFLKSQYYAEHINLSNSISELLYCRKDYHSNHRLYWRVSFPRISYYIDVMTGTIDYEHSMVAY